MNEKKSETSSKYVDKSLFGEQWQIRKVGYITMDNWSLIFWFPDLPNDLFRVMGGLERGINVINTSTEKTSYAH